MNELHHLSKLRLNRYLTGELSEDEVADLAPHLDSRAQAHLDAVAELRMQLPPLDVVALRARADGLPDTSPTEIYDDAIVDPSADDSEQHATGPAPPIDLAAYRRSRTLTTVLSGLLLAAAAVFAIIGWFSGFPSGPDPEHFAVRAPVDLSIHVAQGGQLYPYEPGSPVGAGDVLGFRVTPGAHRGVVLLSVDGTGMVSVFFPAEGVDPVPLTGPGAVELPGTVMLDGAPGPEVFVAVFDVPATDAKELVRTTYWQDGHAGLRRLGTRADVAVAEVKRR